MPTRMKISVFTNISIVGLYRYIGIYQEILMKILIKKNCYDKNWSKFIKILGNTQNDRTNNNILIYEEINIWVI